MASMSQTLIYLPKVSHHLPTKITTILLNDEQIFAIQDPVKWKLLKAPFGGGKTVVLAEIAKNLLKVFENVNFLFSFLTFNACLHSVVYRCYVVTFCSI